VLLGLYYSDRERYSEAEQELKKAVELAPANEVALRLLGLNYLFQGRYNDALDRLLRSLKSQASDRTYVALGATYYYLHRFPEAVAAVETANDISPERYEHWGNLGAYYKWVKGSEARAIPALRKAAEMAEKRLQVTPNAYTVRADLSEYWARLGEKKKAMAEIERIPKQARKPVAPVIATAYELIGERAAAIDVLCSNITNPVGLNRIRDDPELQGLWRDPALRRRLTETLKIDAIQ
jgi:tetratricopeptide (TPR) repeat protein